MLEDEEPVAGIQEGEALKPGQFRQEGEARVDLATRRSRKQAGVTDMRPAGVPCNEEVPL